MFEPFSRMTDDLAREGPRLAALSVAWCVAATVIFGYGTFAIVRAWRRRRAARDRSRPLRYGRNLARTLMASVRRSSEIWFFVPAFLAAIAGPTLVCAVAVESDAALEACRITAFLGGLVLVGSTVFWISPLMAVVSLFGAIRARNDADAVRGIRPLIGSAGALVAAQIPLSAAWMFRLFNE